MKPLDIYVDNKRYEYVNNLTITDKNYIAFTDFQNVFIKEYKTNGNDIQLFDIDDNTFNLVKKEMQL